MAYSADTFVADEQPTTAKWNKLWSNDASFNDGSGLNNISNPIVANSANHLVLTPGTSKLVKVAVLRQTDTTNAYKNNTIILTGTGVITQTAVPAVAESVTYGLTFDATPVVLPGNYGSDYAASSTMPSGNRGKAASISIDNHSTTGFRVVIDALSGNFTNAQFSAYGWAAIGELA